MLRWRSLFNQLVRQSMVHDRNHPLVNKRLCGRQIDLVLAISYSLPKFQMFRNLKLLCQEVHLLYTYLKTIIS